MHLNQLLRIAHQIILLFCVMVQHLNLAISLCLNVVNSYWNSEESFFWMKYWITLLSILVYENLARFLGDLLKGCRLGICGILFGARLLLRFEMRFFTTVELRQIQNRFRVPFSMFGAIVVECKDSNIFGRMQIGVEFKLLGCLRILGRGEHHDDAAEILLSMICSNYLSRTIRRLIMMYMIIFLKEKNWIRLWLIMLR